jgi:KUP system potassium uptake protein
MPTSIAILALLFLIQKNGSSKIAKYFGPYMLVWFFTIGTIGLLQILKSPQILLAFNPYYGIMFIANYKFSALLTFGAIVLVVTGAEALYADIGHFTKQSVRLAWTIVVFPALMLNYLGQGALLIDNPEAIANPFYLLVPSWAGYPLIILSTFASIIASQSIISGVFSMSWQAIQLGYFPRMKVIHTSSHRIGQVYLPAVNVIMCILTILAVLLFENSDRMAAAYGISVTGMMLITTTLGIILATTHWKWSKWKVALIFSPLLLLDTIFATTNFDKILGGGWFPIMITIAIYYVITTWREGRKALDACIHRVNKLSLIDFIKQEPAKQQTRIPGTAVYMYHPSEQIPTTLEFNLLHNKFLHEKIIFLSIATQEVPKIHLKDRIHIEEIEKDIFIVTVNYGFIEVPNLHTIFERIKEVAHIEDLNQLSFFLAKSVPVPSNTSKLSSWKVKLFIFLARNAIGATEFFKIPYNRVLEMGLRYKI